MDVLYSLSRHRSNVSGGNPLINIVLVALERRREIAGYMQVGLDFGENGFLSEVFADTFHK